MSDLINVSAGKSASQSSYSKWSLPNESENALNAALDRPFAFHTDSDDEPWWMVDLGDIYPIHSIVVGNRSGEYAQRARTLSVEISRDGKTWQTVHSGFMVWPLEHTFSIANELIGRYVRLSLNEKQYLHLTKVEVWSNRSPLTVVCNRGDGFGCRLEALIRGGYLAKVLNCDFKVRWTDKVQGLAAKFSDQNCLDGNAILGHSVEPAPQIFSKEFIASSFETGKMATSSKLVRRKNLCARDIHNPFVHDEPGVLYGPAGYKKVSYNQFLAPDSAFGYPDIFWSLQFSPKMKVAINSALKIPLKDRSAALHIRSGDIVYGEYRKQGTLWMKKAVPIPLAQMAIERLKNDGYQVVIFGDDISSIRSLKSEFPEILLAIDYNKQGFSGAAGALFDIVLMSRMNLIWAGDSGFARIANDISRGGEFQKIHELFSVAEMVSYFKSQIPKFEKSLHPRQTAFSLWSLYCISKNLSMRARIKLLDQLNDLDPENLVYLVVKVCVLLENAKLSQADKVLGEFLYDGWQVDAQWGGNEASKVIMSSYSGQLHLRRFLEPIYNIAKVSEDSRHTNVLVFLAMIAAGKGDKKRASHLMSLAEIANAKFLHV